MKHVDISSEKGRVSTRARNLFRIFFLITGVILIGSGVLIYKSRTANLYNNIKNREAVLVSIRADLISSVFNRIIGDLLFLSRQNELMALLDKFNVNVQATELEYQELAYRKKIYDQVRFLDASGRERIRINYRKGRALIVPKRDLQDKSKRYYFNYTLMLDRGNVFVSPLDLNVEKGKIEQPLKPMIRFGTPVFDKRGRKRGIVLINYLASYMLDGLKSFNRIMKGRIMLLNAEGYWLLSPDPDDEWGFMIKTRKHVSFEKKYPQEWGSILVDKKGVIHSANGLFVFSTVYPLLENYRTSTGSIKSFSPRPKYLNPHRYFWILVSHVPQKVLSKEENRLIVFIVLIGLGLFVTITSGAWFISLFISRRRAYQECLLDMALYDPLTKIPNRRLFFDRLDVYIAHASRYKRRVGLIYIDLDEFKAVNDCKGHESGDELLIAVAEKIKEAIRDSDMVARLGGDEFVVILPEIDSVSSIIPIGEKIVKTLANPFGLACGTVTIGASAGGAVYPDHAENSDSLINEADKAMYRAKRQRRGNFFLAGND